MTCSRNDDVVASDNHCRANYNHTRSHDNYTSSDDNDNRLDYDTSRHYHNTTCHHHLDTRSVSLRSNRRLFRSVTFCRFGVVGRYDTTGVTDGL